MTNQSSGAGPPLFDHIDQIGVVVRDVGESIGYYENFFGKGAFTVIEGEAPATLADGTEEKIKGKLAFLQLGPIQLELIEIKEGRSAHVDFLEQNGEGIHHLGIYVSDFDERMEHFRKRGIDVIQSGQGLRRYAYLDTRPIILELIDKG